MVRTKSLPKVYLTYLKLKYKNENDLHNLATKP